METKLFLLQIWGGVEPLLFGPYKTWTTRDRAAKRLYKKDGDQHGYFKLTVVTNNGRTRTSVDSYVGDFFEE